MIYLNPSFAKRCEFLLRRCIPARMVFMVIGLCIAATSIHAQVIYPAPANLPPSPDYTVSLNGKAAFVYSCSIPASYCSFDMTKPVEVIIKANRDIKWVDLRPYAAGIRPQFGKSDSTIRFTLLRPVQLSVELNGSKTRPLFLFANPPETEKPEESDSNTLFFKAGKVYSPGLIRLKSNQTVYIEGGAVVFGSIEGKQAKNSKILGRGILDGTANERLHHRFIDLQDCEKISIGGITLANSSSWQIVPIHCHDVLIHNVKILSDAGGDDGMDIVRSKKVRITNCFVRTKDDCIAVKSNMRYPPSEGVDSVIVENCVFWNGAWGNGLEIGFELNSDEIKNVVFRDNDIIHIESGAAISIHNAGKARVHGILYENIRVEDADQKLFDFAIFRSQYSEDGHLNEDEKRGTYLNGAWDGVLDLAPAEREKHAAYRGSIDHITLRNIQVTGGIFPFSIFYGYDHSHAVKNITVEDFSVYGKKVTAAGNAKCYFENAFDIQFK